MLSKFWSLYVCQDNLGKYAYADRNILRSIITVNVYDIMYDLMMGILIYKVFRDIVNLIW